MTTSDLIKGIARRARARGYLIVAIGTRGEWNENDGAEPWQWIAYILAETSDGTDTFELDQGSTVSAEDALRQLDARLWPAAPVGLAKGPVTYNPLKASRGEDPWGRP